MGGGGPEYDLKFGALQSGMDVYRSEHEDGSRDHAGFYLAYGSGNTDVTQKFARFERDAGTNRFNAFSAGGYWTRYGADDWYIDSLVQGTWYNVSAQTAFNNVFGLPNQDVDGFGFGASLEGGYPFQLGGGWQIEPQAQLIYQTVSFGSFHDLGSEVSFDDYNSLAGRLGARAARNWAMEPGSASAPPRLATFWGQLDLWQEFLGDATTTFSSAQGSVPFSTDLDETWIEASLGATLQMNANASLYGNVGYQTTFDGDAWGVDGKIGLRVNW